MKLRPLLLIAASLAAACSRDGDGKGAGGVDEALPPPTYELALPKDLGSLVDKKFTGDLDAMIERRLIRIAVPFNRTHYFIDKGIERGISYEYVKLFEEQLNKKLNTGNLKIHVVRLPEPRDRLLPALNDGRVDIVIAAMTVTPERQQLVDFTNPTRKGVNEVVVTGRNTANLTSPDQLGGTQIFVRKSSSYFQSLKQLNDRLKARGKPPVAIEEVPESLEDDDLLEMVNAGLIPATVVDDYLATFWTQVFPNMVIQNRAPVRVGAQLGLAFRKGSPKLAAELNQFIAEYGLDTATGRTINQRYLQSTKFVASATSEEERNKFLAMVELFRKYGAQYDVDYLLMAAQGFQESRLDQNAKSHVGAIGVMQIMPATGAELNVGNISQVEPNIHGGVKYMRQLQDEFFKDEPIDPLNKLLLTFASYNAGPGRVRQLRREATARGLNPNVWFGNVEQIASERIGRETVTYVSNIYKYYIAYRLVTQQREQQLKAKGEIKPQASR